MIHIDFLPESYRQLRESRRLPLGHLVAAIAITAGVGLSALAQTWQQAHLKAQLKAIDPAHQSAKNQLAQLAQLQTDVKQIRRDAALGVFLERPWPRSRVLAELVQCKDDSITLRSIQMSSQPVQPLAAPGRRAPARRPASAPQDPSSLDDLGQLQHKLRGHVDQVVLEGETADSAALYRYVHQLTELRQLFSKVELDLLETETASPGASFRIQAQLQPSFGQADVEDDS